MQQNQIETNLKIEEAGFYIKKPLLLHFYMLPYIFLFPILFSKYGYEMMIILGLISGGLYLSTFWSIKIYLIMCYRKIHYSISGEISKLYTYGNQKSDIVFLYKNMLCQIFYEKIKGNLKVFFIYQNQKYFIDNLTTLTIKKIQPEWNYTLREIKEFEYKQKYSDHFLENKLIFPNKTFTSLFKEQITNPLFCFSIFSSILTLFDDHIMNSLLSIALSLLVEALLCVNRLTTLKMFQNYKIVNQPVTKIIFNNNEKNELVINSVELKPGDIVLLNNKCKVRCDCLLIEGSVIVNESMLSGETIPLLKQGIKSTADLNEFFGYQKHKKYILYSGTDIIKVKQNATLVVLKTGFDTEQGRLLNTMLNSEEITYDKEALKLVIILTIISLISSILMFFYSKKTGYPLFLDIIILFTNSIPFELPMEMSTIIQTITRNLYSKGIYCLEPYRIQLAGKLNICCFDKTGTLTESKLVLNEIISFCDDIELLMGSCNDLQIIDGKIAGDPLDMAIYDFLKDAKYFSEDRLLPNNVEKISEYPFSSELRRQAVIVKHNSKLMYICKGAPETLQYFLKTIPKEYYNYESYAKEGYRVIALGYKEVKNAIINISEDRLLFGGFLLFGTTLKPYAKEMISILQKSNHKVIMITGDNKYTALNISKKLEIQGDAIEETEIDNALIDGTIEKYSVFARADPSHKEKIIKWYRKQGLITMMVGDGTNDVGALKAADVGIAMLEGTINEQKEFNLNSIADDTIKPGDASIAAPFTIKSKSLRPIIEIILQGRTCGCTIVQMYKILTLNSLINSFTMAFLDLFQIKFSEKQMLALGILNSLAFNALSRGKTLDKIDKKRVIDSIFNPGLIVSVVLQGILHNVCFGILIYIFRDNELIKNYFTYNGLLKEKVKFKPNQLNTAVFFLGMVQTIATFTFNYIGRPFREDIHENVTLLMSLIGMLAIPLNILLIINADLNQYLECVDIKEYQKYLLSLCIGLITITWMIDKFSKNLMMK